MILEASTERYRQLSILLSGLVSLGHLYGGTPISTNYAGVFFQSHGHDAIIRSTQYDHLYIYAPLPFLYDVSPHAHSTISYWTSFLKPKIIGC